MKYTGIRSVPSSVCWLHLSKQNKVLCKVQLHFIPFACLCVCLMCFLSLFTSMLLAVFFFIIFSVRLPHIVKSCYHGRRKDFSRGGGTREFFPNFFGGGAKVVKFVFFPLKTKKTFFAENFKIQGWTLARSTPPSGAHDCYKTLISSGVYVALFEPRGSRRVPFEHFNRWACTPKTSHDKKVEWHKSTIRWIFNGNFRF